MAVAVRVQFAESAVPAAGGLDRPALRRLLTRGVRAACRHEGVRTAEMSVTLVDDASIADMNQRFLQHQGPTDVISFALFEDGEDPVGDVYVGLEQARRQAEGAGVPLDEELLRLAVHGTLHVLGHDHPHGADRLESAMWQRQETIVAAVLQA